MIDVLDHHLGVVPNDPIVLGRLRLSAIIPNKLDHWRVYIDRFHHSEALATLPHNPGSFYDCDKSPGFQQSMENAYEKVLEGDDYVEHFTTGLITFDEYTALYNLSSRNIRNRTNIRQRPADQDVLFGIDPARIAADALNEEVVPGRPLFRDITDMTGNAQHAISFLDVTLPDGPRARTHTNLVDYRTLVTAAFTRYNAEMTGAHGRRDQLRAIAKLIRFLHVFHMFMDGNGRLHCHLLLPRLLLENGFGLPLKLGNLCATGTVFGLFNGCFTLDQIVTFLWFAQQTDTHFEDVSLVTIIREALKPSGD
jgi:hypothetical protein